MEIEIEPEDWTIIVADEKEYEEYYQEQYEYLEKGEEQHTDPEGTECTWKDQIINGEFRIPVLHSSHEVMRGKKETFHCLEIKQPTKSQSVLFAITWEKYPNPMLTRITFFDPQQVLVRCHTFTPPASYAEIRTETGNRNNRDRDNRFRMCSRHSCQPCLIL